MSESVDYRAEFNIEDFVDKYVERVNREIDQRVLDKVEHRLAEYGYVKVVRCRDCAYSIHFLHHDDERWQCTEPHQEGDDVKPDAYCWRGKRKDGDASWPSTSST